MPQIFKIGSYWVFFWANESDPLEPIHVHVCEGAPNANATKIWITKAGKCYLCHNNSRIPERTLRNIMKIIEARSAEVIKMERLLWRGTILLLRLFRDFPPVFLFGSKISAHSTKPAPPFLNLSVRTAQPCSSPAPRRASSHPLQNRVPRGAGRLWRPSSADRGGSRDKSVP